MTRIILAPLAVPKFKWTPSARSGYWILAGGPRARYPLGGVTDPRDALAMAVGDAAWLSTHGYQWYDPRRWDEPWADRWRSRWPDWLWPADARPMAPFLLQLCREAGVRPVRNSGPKKEVAKRVIVRISR